MMSGKAEASVLLTNATGLHARPAVKVTKLAKSFKAKLEIAPAGRNGWIDAKSIVKVMALKVPQSTELSIRAEGEDAEAAIAALVALIERHFDEGAGGEESGGSDAGGGAGSLTD
jgi:phosphocarrier protein HPr